MRDDVIDSFAARLRGVRRKRGCDDDSLLMNGHDDSFSSKVRPFSFALRFDNSLSIRYSTQLVGKNVKQMSLIYLSSDLFSETMTNKLIS